MSHNLYRNRMMYVGKKPWHGLGVGLDEPQTAEEAIKIAHLDYEVAKVPIYTHEGGQIEGFFATFNKEEKCALGIVGDRYQIIPNREAFGFFDAIVGEKLAIYHTAGALGRGERIWLLAKLPKNLIVFKDDVIEKYLCLTNSHDGKRCLRVYFTPIRVVCQNTLNMSISSVGKEGVAIRHVGNISSKVQEAKRVLGLALDFYKEFDEVVEAFGRKKLNTSEARTYYDKVLEISDKEESSTRTENVRGEMLNLFERGKGNDNPQVRHSLWAAYNGVTEYVDHYATIRNVTRDPSRRLDNIWFGRGKDLKLKAYEEALVLVK